MRLPRLRTRPRRPFTPDPDAYPDLAAAGGLAAAVSAVAARHGLDLGEVRASSGSERLLSASVDTERGPYVIQTTLGGRRFTVAAWSRGVLLLGGDTRDLVAVVRAAAAWRGGASLERIRELCPFVTFDALAEAHERGPADAVTAQWNELRRDGPEATRDVLEAAYAQPRLRMLFPVVGHSMLGFSRCTGYPYSRDEPSIEPLDGGRHAVHLHGVSIGVTATADAAVALAVSHLPAGCGPAVAGTVDEL